MGEFLFTLLLIGMVAETAREAYLSPWWEARHYRAMSSLPPYEQTTRRSRMFLPELPWWAARKSRGERREHQRKWHIDLLARPRLRRRK